MDLCTLYQQQFGYTPTKCNCLMKIEDESQPLFQKHELLLFVPHLVHYGSLHKNFEDLKLKCNSRDSI